MKTDRFSPAFKKAAAVALAGLLVAAGAGGQVIRFGFKRKSTATVTTESTAAVLARQVAEVRQRFDKDRRALRAVTAPGGEPAYRRAEVEGLIDRTGKDLDQAIEQVGEPGLDALRAWSADEIRRIKEELGTAPGQAAAASPASFAPRAVARIASLGGLPEPAEVRAAAATVETVGTRTSDTLLDRMGQVVGRILFLAETDDLEVDLWVGSAPAPATFLFWSQGKLRGTAQSPWIIPTNGRKERVLRGLYVYRASLDTGPVTELVQFPAPAGAAFEKSERLDLVNGSSFFCCQFGRQSCRHVASEKECRS